MPAYRDTLQGFRATTQTLAGRLEWAIDQQPRRGRERGVRLFQRRIASREVDGTALSTIQSYLKGESHPSVAFIEEAAQVLGIRPAWLAFNDGWPTEAEQKAIASAAEKLESAFRSIRAQAPQAEKLIAAFRARECEVRDSIAEGIPGFAQLPEASRRDILRAFGRYWRLPSTLSEFGDKTPAESWDEVIGRFTAYLATPYSVLGIEPASLDAASRALFIDAMLRAIDVARLARHPEQED